MCLDLSYQEIMSSQDPKFAVRYQMVMSALSKGIRPTMRDFQCSRNTVRLWLRRYQEQGLAGLEERSRAPHHIPHKTPPEVEQQVVEARDAIPCFGPRRLKRYFDLPCSTGAIARILQQSGRSQRRKKTPPGPGVPGPRNLGGRPSACSKSTSKTSRICPATGS